MAFLAANTITNRTTTGPVKSDMEAWLAACKQVAGAADETTLTISSGAVTATGWCHQLDTEGATATDDLTAINLAAGSEVRLLVVRCADPSRVVTMKHGSGLSLAGGLDAVLDSTARRLVLVRQGSSWAELCRSWSANGGFSAHKNGTAQTGLADITAVKITFGTEEYDLRGEYDAVNSRFQPKNPGIYRISAQVYMSATVLVQLAELPREAQSLFMLPYAMTAYTMWRAKETGFRRAAESPA